jgi:hypothetical protein
MPVRSNINIHLTDDTRLNVHRGGDYVWIAIGPEVLIFVDSENQLAEIAQAVDVAAKLLEERL